MDFLKTIIFIGTNKSGSSREAVQAAVRLGYFTVLFTQNEKQIRQRREYTDIHEMTFVDITSLSAMKKEVAKLQARGNEVITIVSFIDSYVATASKLCEEFCPNGTSAMAAEIMESKSLTRERLADQPYTPAHFTLSPGESPELPALNHLSSYPLIVKISSSTGSKNVLKVYNQKEMYRAVDMFQRKTPEEAIIIEEFIEGDQYLVEAMICDGSVNIIGVIEQEITIGKRFIITGYGVLGHVPHELHDSIKDVLESIQETLNIRNGALHLELRKTKSGWRLIEINPRISGGAMNSMLKVAFGFDVVEETLKLYVGDVPNLTPMHQRYVYTQYVIVDQKGILEKVTGKGRAMKSAGVKEVYIKPKKGTWLTPPLSMGHRYAYVIASGDTLEEAKALAKSAAQHIQFHLQLND
ncbi:ATP-grasp domain-containing protein [Sporosarcina sp. PTS2304]|uniref:ATP-grasp domain-containing protein n=1 Tax=Sporosarcina sp. PTS2304 TaxID=2283194 RepID=UPI000E0D58E8|nr:ATP-grasp domain-containing protein [Sporosarcina sp. PTS2304]AXI00023.1 ATP-grasp domain-containing protein [Sporosarcina sp. PTS2304]